METHSGRVRMANSNGQYSITAALYYRLPSFPPVIDPCIVDGEVQGTTLGHIGSRALSVRLFHVLGIRRWPLSIDILYYDRRCFPPIGKYTLTSYTRLSRELVSGGRGDGPACTLIRVHLLLIHHASRIEARSRICAFSASCPCAA